ncbi:hypothetical protein O181_017358 [Austropuccinia psidii MF-1]|uniref:Uncharacterized protein n=1 Tax=Austropuccinia psidii MF-1 TaxID=1389203 RepID=A0A9Q3C6Z2_9BASI|nr:hypothetical protein [Austropuccinia psidii MF-1]
MFRRIWLFIFFCYLYDVNSSLAETSSLSHLEAAADLNETGSQGLKYEAESALLTSSRPATPLKVQSKQKLKNLQISESCMNEDSSNINDRQNAPLQPGALVQSRPLEQGAVEQPRHSQISTKHLNDRHQTEASNYHHSAVPQTSVLRSPSNDDEPFEIWKAVFRSVAAPYIIYANTLVLDHYEKRVVRPYKPININKGPEAESKFLQDLTKQNEENHANCFQTGKNENPLPPVGVNNSGKSMSSKEISLPQSEAISRVSKISPPRKCPHILTLSKVERDCFMDLDHFTAGENRRIQEVF